MFSKSASALRDYYTDILCHQFSPHPVDGADTYVAVGTNFGDMYMIRCDDTGSPEDIVPVSTNDSESEPNNNARFVPKCLWRLLLPGKEDEPVINLAWDKSHPRLYILSNRKLYRMTQLDLEDGLNIEPVYGSLPEWNNFTNFSLLPDSNVVCIVGDDRKTRVVDLETQKVLIELQGHTGIVETCKATSQYVATGSLDGVVNLYESRFRTSNTICSFGDNRNPINNLDLSRNSVWLAVSGVNNSDFPTLYNVRSGKQVPFSTMSPQSTKTEQISALHFDSNDTLYWGGYSGSVFRSEDLLISCSELKGTFGVCRIPQVLSITTRNLDTPGVQLSAGGTSNAILFSSRGLYWDSMLQVESGMKMHQL